MSNTSTEQEKREFLQYLQAWKTISDNIVRPYVLKGGAELHPLVGFVAAFGALDAIGFYGVFIGPVVAGLFFALLPIVTRSYGPENRA